MSDDLLCHKLLEAANLSETDERIVKAATTEINLANVKKALKQIFGETTGNQKVQPKIKTEPVYHASGAEGGQYQEGHHNNEEKIFYADKWRSKKYGYKPNNAAKSNIVEHSKQKVLKYPIPLGRNPLDRYGYITHCNICYSVNHWQSECPDRPKENLRESKLALHQVVILFEEEEEDPGRLKTLVHETMSCAVLDSGCARTVCGNPWFKTYISTLDKEQEDEIIYSESKSVFKFGSGGGVKSIVSATIPIVIGSKKIALKVDVVPDDIPLLLSRRSMKMAGTVMDTIHDKVTMLGEEIPLIVTSTDHYAIPITANRAILETSLKTNTKIVLYSHNKTMTRQEIAKKLHSQFAHPPADRLLRLLNNSDYRDDKELKKSVQQVSESCEVCKRYKPTPRRPVVGMPLSTQFNETVAMDIKLNS